MRNRGALNEAYVMKDLFDGIVDSGWLVLRGIPISVLHRLVVL